MIRGFYLSEASFLAIHSMAYIVKHKNDERMSVKKIAEATNASENHLSKVFQRLVKAGLLKSTRGPKGGFSLNRKPNEISFLDIYEAIEGKMHSDFCEIRKKNRACPFDKCIFDGIFNKISAEMIEYMKNKTLGDFIKFKFDKAEDNGKKHSGSNITEK
jgi:Rrf2 family protein